MQVHCQMLSHDSVYPGMVTASLWLVSGDRPCGATTPDARPPLQEGQLPSASSIRGMVTPPPCVRLLFMGAELGWPMQVDP